MAKPPDAVAVLFEEIHRLDDASRRDAAVLVNLVLDFLTECHVATREQVAEYLSRNAQGMELTPDRAQLKRTLDALAALYAGPPERARPVLGLIQGGLPDAQEPAPDASDRTPE